jgi:hypothetical protein
LQGARERASDGGLRPAADDRTGGLAARDGLGERSGGSGIRPGSGERTGGLAARNGSGDPGEAAEAVVTGAEGGAPEIAVPAPREPEPVGPPSSVGPGRLRRNPAPEADGSLHHGADDDSVPPPAESA